MTKLNTQLNNELNDYIISFQLAQLVMHYGGIQVKAAIMALDKKRQSKAIPDNRISPKLHILNLANTYGKDSVISIYNAIYKLDNRRKVSQYVVKCEKRVCAIP